MSGITSPTNASAPDPSPGVRPLPPRPNLEFERKQAKHLLRQLHVGDSIALTRLRAHWRGAERTSPEGLQLADAQFVIAREYGFTSWPRLVEYFTTLERHERSGPRGESYPPDVFEQQAQSVLARHRKRRPGAAQQVSGFVPRLYGLSAAEVLAAELTIDEARLVVARENRYPSWAALLEGLAANSEPEGWERFEHPRTKAYNAIRESDLDALTTIVDANPDLITQVGPHGHTLIWNALLIERRTPSAEARAVTDWLSSRGADLAGALNRMLLGYMHITVGDVESALERGADPAWVPPNGISVIEHAIYRYWNGAAVDVVARLVTPPKAFWIAAGLGDVASLDRYIDAQGRPTDAARRRRPDFMAMGISLPTMPEADDLEILWEGFFLAGLNDRFAVLDLMLERGFPIDYSPFGSTLLHFGVGNRRVRLVEYMVSRGANLDLRGWHPDTTAREAAEWHFQNEPAAPDARRILELCGGRDPETVLASFEARRPKEVDFAPKVIEGLALAQNVARQRGGTEVQPHDIFLAMLHQAAGLPLTFLAAGGVDLARLREAIGEPPGPQTITTPKPDLPYSDSAREVLASARAEAERRRRSHVHLHLLWALLGSDSGPVAGMLRSAGADLERVRGEVARVL